MILVVAIAACRPDRSSNADQASSSLEPAIGPPEAGVAASAETGKAPDPLDEKLRHCPLTVDGARAEIADAPGGVEIVVTASQDEAVQDIRRRVRHIEEFTRKAGKDTGVPHGAGAGGGWMRNCPVVTKDTLVAGTDIDHGVRIHIRPLRAEALGELRSEVRRRKAALKL
jgi:TusA-related sulfurtransferase